MAINTEGLRATLRVKIKEVLDTPINNASNPEKVKQDFANKIADAVAEGVDKWIKTATVTVHPGISVTTSSGTGVTTSSGTGIIS